MDNFYSINLAAFKKKNKSLCDRIDKAPLSDTVKGIKSKSGEVVPVVLSGDREYPLHSRFKPIEEGVRLAASYSNQGTLIFLGFGGGYHIEPFLKSGDIELIFIVVPTLSLFKSVMIQRDLTIFINDPRIHFLVEEEEHQVIHSIQSFYIPLLGGAIQTIPLLSVLRFNKEYLETIFNGISRLIKSVKADFSAQHHFGKQWFHNSIKNLFRMVCIDNRDDKGINIPSKVINIPSKVIIAAAGPSLEKQIALIKRDYESRFLIAVDTSVPVLLKCGVRPDLIVSIDCQVISRGHFMSMPVKDIPVILDIASSVSVVERFDYPLFCGSRHPFSRYLVEKGWDIPLLDFSGGNVTHAALEVAHYGGAKDIILAGADFGYPWGKSYARGSHLYDYFNIRAGRCEPLEQGFYSLLMRSPFDRRQTPYGECYIPEKMDFYKEQLEMLVSSFSAECRIEALEGEGQTLNFSTFLNQQSSDKQLFVSKRLENKRVFSLKQLSEFLLQYVHDLEALEDLSYPLCYSFEKLSDKERSLWLTIIPYAAKGSGNVEKKSSHRVLSEAKNMAVDYIRQYI